MAASSASTAVNTSFLERQNGTDRHRNARNARDRYCFSKAWAVHELVTGFTLFRDNFCWPVRTLAPKDATAAGRCRRRRPCRPAWPTTRGACGVG